MALIARLLFLLALVIVPVFEYATSAALPDRVATHFGMGGAANGWMGRDGYLAFILAFSTLLPIIVVAMSRLLPRLSASRMKIPNREYWLAPERRAQTFGWLTSHAFSLGFLLCLFIGALHALVLQANAQTPPRLVEPVFFVILGAFLVGFVAWIGTIRLHFRRTG